MSSKLRSIIYHTGMKKLSIMVGQRKEKCEAELVAPTTRLDYIFHISWPYVMLTPSCTYILKNDCWKDICKRFFFKSLSMKEIGSYRYNLRIAATLIVKHKYK